MLGTEKGQAAGKTLKYVVEIWAMGMCDDDHDCRSYLPFRDLKSIAGPERPQKWIRPPRSYRRPT